MTRKGVSRSKPVARQALARRKTLDYINRLGLRKAAHRLDTNVRELRKWLKPEVGFPSDRLELAIGLGKPGGAFVYVKGTRLSDLIKEKGLRGAATLTGIPGKKLAEQVKKKPTSRIKFNRERLRKMASKKGLAKLAEILHAKPKNIEGAARRPFTSATERLRALAKTYGNADVANFLGISEKQLKQWLLSNIPRPWEEHVNFKIGARRPAEAPATPTEAEVRRRRPYLKAEIQRAVKKARAWNSRTSPRYRINLREAERWARLGIFEEKFRSAKDAYSTSRKPVKPGALRKPPRRPPFRPIIPPTARMPPRPPKKQPKGPPKIPTEPAFKEIEQKKKRDFLQARAEAFIDGRYPKPIAPWGRLKKWDGQNRQGITTYTKIEKFVHELDLDRIGNEIIKKARKLWKMVEGREPFMSIRCTFSIMGEGNPFYPDSFHEGDRVTFPITTVILRDESDVEAGTRELIQRIYYTDVETTMLFFEYYEIVMSVQK